MKKAARPLVVGNWKMNPVSITVAKRLFKDICLGIPRMTDTEIVIAPPALYFTELLKLKNGKKIKFCTQDIFWEKMGAYTGELSLPMYKGLSLSYSIIGHSERRALGETDEEVNKKIHAILKTDVTPIVCIGERARDSHGTYLSLIEKQIREACKSVSKMKIKRLVIAYEPIWAIGTGKTATATDAHEMKLFIKKILTNLYGRNISSHVRVLYGGSVKPTNANDLVRNGEVDGFLIGGASLKAKDFIEIVRTVNTYAKE